MKYSDDDHRYDPNEYTDDTIYRRPRNKKPTTQKKAAHKSSPERSSAQSANKPSSSVDDAASSALSQRMQKRQKKSARKKLWKRVLQVCLVCILVFSIVGVGMCVGMYAAVSTEIKDMNIENLTLNYSSFIYYYDEDGMEQQLEQISGENKRIWVNSDKISDNLKNATVAIEDERFYSHHGFDIKRTIGATVKWGLSKIGIGSSDYGGSTITQQVIKNITNEKTKSPTRKIKEILRAVALEKQLSKDQILTMYLNIVFFANGCYGVETAANTYYNKSASDLNIAEAAAIVGITQRPANFDPYVHPENTLEKRNLVLKKMYELKMISEEEYNAAVNSDLNISKTDKKASDNISSYFAEAVYNDVLADLQSQKGYSKEFAQQQLSNGGLKVYCTMDKDIQEDIDRVFTDKSNFTDESAQAAMVIIDPYTGEIKGLAGGMGKKTENSVWNRATQAKRQPGSAFKPIAVYAPAFDTGKIDSSTVLKDEEIEVGNDNWKPKNSYSGFKGDMLVKEAIERSSNIPAVKVLDQIGLSTSMDYVQNKFKIPLNDKDKNYSSLSLGGLTDGVSVERMAAAYSVFVNSGKYIEPHTYTKVTDNSGKVILENNPGSNQAISPAAAYIMSDMLYAVVNGENGTGTRAKLSNMPTYGKTGTTNDNFDKWFVGYTPYYVGAVWYGYDTPKELTGTNPTVTVWKKVMSQVHDDLSKKELTKPSTVTSEEICTISGNLAKSGCPTDTAYYLTGKQPRKTCSSHKAIASDSSSTTKKPSSSTKTAKSSSSPTSDNEDIAATTAPAKTTTPSKTSSPTRTQAPSDNEDTGGSSERTQTPQQDTSSDNTANDTPAQAQETKTPTRAEE